MGKGKRVRATYTQRLNGEKVPIKRRTHVIRCCDCGLVHILRFYIRGGGLSFRAWRDERRTAASRRTIRYEKD